MDHRRIILSFGQGVYQPGLQSLLTRIGSARERGRLLALPLRHHPIPGAQTQPAVS